MTYTPDRDKLAALLEAVDIADQAIRHLVIDELAHVVLPEYEQAEAKAAERLGVALEALKGPESALAAIDADIAKAESAAADWGSQARSGSVGDRVAARAWFAEWDAELSALKGKRDSLEQDMQPAVLERDKARAALEVAAEDRRAAEFNCSDPQYAFNGFGRRTSAYQLRVLFGFLGPILEAGNELHAEWGAGLEWLEALCVKSGYRTDGSSGREKLLSPREAKVAEGAEIGRMLAEHYAKPFPTGAEVVAETAESLMVPAYKDANDRLLATSTPDPWAGGYDRALDAARAAQVAEASSKRTRKRTRREFMDAPRVPDGYRKV